MPPHSAVRSHIGMWHLAMCSPPKSSNWKWIKTFLLLAFHSVYMKYLPFAIHVSSPSIATWSDELQHLSSCFSSFVVSETRKAFFSFLFVQKGLLLCDSLLILQMSLMCSLPWGAEWQTGFVETWFTGKIIISAYYSWNINPLCIILFSRIFHNCWLPDRLRLLSNVWSGTFQEMLLLFASAFTRAIWWHTSNRGLCEWQMMDLVIHNLTNGSRHPHITIPYV